MASESVAPTRAAASAGEWTRLAGMVAAPRRRIEIGPAVGSEGIGMATDTAAAGLTRPQPRHGVGGSGSSGPGCACAVPRPPGTQLEGVRGPLGPLRRTPRLRWSATRLEGGALLLQRPGVPRGHVRSVQGPVCSGQRELPLPRGRAHLPARQLRRRGRRVLRRPRRPPRRRASGVAEDRHVRLCAGPTTPTPSRTGRSTSTPPSIRPTRCPPSTGPATTSGSCTPAGPPACPRASCGRTAACSASPGRRSASSRRRSRPPSTRSRARLGRSTSGARP